MCSVGRLFLNGARGLNVLKSRNSESKIQKHFEEIHPFNETGRKFDDVT